MKHRDIDWFTVMCWVGVIAVLWLAGRTFLWGGP